MPTPRISILIPNFNNGRESSKSGTRDFLGDLFESLERTLLHDPTPLEILVDDDGSTDDSLETCRRWAQRRWPDGPRRGQPFMRLEAHEHCGVLSVVANRLTGAARGDICCRLDGDITVETPRWAARLCEIFDRGPARLGIVGPKQLGVDGSIHCAGSWILHPRGHHHVAMGAPRHAVTRSLEVDHVMGCFYCHRRCIWEELGGYDEKFLRGQTVDFGLAARKAGWSAWSVPDIEFTHYHAERSRRTTRADSDGGIEDTLDYFTEKWGFDRIAPDLDAVRDRYAGTGLLWNARVFGPRQPTPPPSAGPVELQGSQWTRYGADDGFQAEINRRASVVQAMRSQLDAGDRVLVVGCNSGLLCHLLAQTGLTVRGIDRDPELIALARRVTASQSYRGPAPEFDVQRDERTWPTEDHWADVVLLFEVLEHCWNPVGVYRESHRVLAPEGLVAVVTRERRGVPDGGEVASEGYRPHELVLQMKGTRLFTPMSDTVPQAAGTMTLFGRRRKAGEGSFYGEERGRGGTEARRVVGASAS